MKGTELETLQNYQTGPRGPRSPTGKPIDRDPILDPESRPDPRPGPGIGSQLDPESPRGFLGALL